MGQRVGLSSGAYRRATVAPERAGRVRVDVLHRACRAFAHHLRDRAMCPKPPQKAALLRPLASRAIRPTLSDTRNCPIGRNTNCCIAGVAPPHPRHPPDARLSRSGGHSGRERGVDAGLGLMVSVVNGQGDVEPPGLIHASLAIRASDSWRGISESTAPGARRRRAWVHGAHAGYHSGWRHARARSATFPGPWKARRNKTPCNLASIGLCCRLHHPSWTR